MAPPVNIKSVKFIAASIDTIDTKDIPIAVLKANLNNICFDKIIVSRIMDVIIPFIIASVIIKDIGHAISIN
jgi:hypothetical protein